MKKLIVLMIFPLISFSQCWQSIDTGVNHTLAIRNDGTLWAWGFSGWGATNTNNDTNWLKVSAGNWHSAGIKSDGKLWTWGNNFYGQCGNGTSGQFANGAMQQIGNENWSMVSCGLYYTLLIKSDGTLWSMGDNTYGQHGLGNSFSIIPAQIGADTNWKQVTANDRYSIGVKTNGTLWAWGTGYLGNGAISTTNVPIQIGSDNDWDKIANCGTFAIKTNGTIWGWGYNQFGQLGDGTIISRTTPIQIGTDTNWQKICSYSSHTIALKSNGTIYTWGNNQYGQLGNGVFSNTNTLMSTQLGSETNWQDIAVGEWHSTALKNDGSLFNWGFNGDDRLGDGTGIDKNIPTQVSCLPLNIENFLDNSFNIYPNPAKDFVGIKKSDNLLIDKFIVIDIYGKVVIDEKNFDDKLNIQQLPNGIYLLQINCQNRKFNYKFIKE